MKVAGVVSEEAGSWMAFWMEIVFPYYVWLVQVWLVQVWLVWLVRSGGGMFGMGRSWDCNMWDKDGDVGIGRILLFCGGQKSSFY